MILSFILLSLVWLLPSESKLVCEQRQQSQMLKFIASLLVVVGHETCFYTTMSHTIVSETSAGSLCVAFFLFMSGYGLLYGFVSKGQKLDWGWICKRLLKLIVPALTAMAIYLMVELLFGKDIDWRGVLKYWFVSDINLRYGWYVTEILVLYLAFYLCFRYLAEHRAFVVLCCVVMFAVAVMVACKSARWFIQGLPAFLMGLALARIDLGLMKNRMRKPRGAWLKVCASVGVVAFFLLKDFNVVQHVVPALDKWRYTYLSFFMCDVMFVVLAVYVLKRLPVCSRMANRGGYFYEVYLVQGATLLLCRELIADDALFVLAGLLVTVVVAKVMSVINGWMAKCLCGAVQRLQS